MITPCPPGIPAVLPEERLTDPVLHYLTLRRRSRNVPPRPRRPAPEHQSCDG
ncbi:hypothetical protein [Streptomyces sp. NPDC102487]|uniref:hypothetical protein n=1 Tax=Streptomyces sp. NPDC102487 TaxID=3366182 RepID=UPI00382B3AA0